MKARILSLPIEAAALEMLRWLGKFGHLVRAGIRAEMRSADEVFRDADRPFLRPATG